jgi:hypothetical protein
LESKNEDEDEDSSLIRLDFDMKCKGLTPPPQGKLIDLDNLLQSKYKVG